ncbi:MAG: 30S ribosomal protein S4 [Candidatus Nanopelagicales bacterium]
MPRTPVTKLSRHLGIPLTEKAGRIMEGKPFPPGQHGRTRKKPSEYADRLLEKQRLRFQYNITEAQMRRAFAAAAKRPGKTGAELIEDLESRLDAVVLRAGFAKTIYQARQFVVHRHLLVNGQRVDKPSFRVRVGDVVEVRAKSRTMPAFVTAKENLNGITAPAYLEVSHDHLQARFRRRPERAEIPVICNEQLVVEFYAR